MEDIKGVNEDQMRPQSRRNNTTMDGADLTSLQREIMQSMEGFPINGRSFYPARAALDPPTILCKALLLPAIDE
jgi:hypothetical protein